MGVCPVLDLLVIWYVQCHRSNTMNTKADGGISTLRLACLTRLQAFGPKSQVEKSYKLPPAKSLGCNMIQVHPCSSWIIQIGLFAATSYMTLYSPSSQVVVFALVFIASEPHFADLVGSKVQTTANKCPDGSERTASKQCFHSALSEDLLGYFQTARSPALFRLRIATTWCSVDPCTVPLPDKHHPRLYNIRRRRYDSRYRTRQPCAQPGDQTRLQQYRTRRLRPCRARLYLLLQVLPVPTCAPRRSSPGALLSPPSP